VSIPPPSGPHHQPQPTPGPHGAPPQGPYQAPGPYGPPYPTWGQGYSPFNRPAPVNGVAIAALVLGILCFLPAVGLVLGVVALVQIRRKGERGKGMAIAGSVLSAVGLALWTVALATGGASEMWEGFKEGARGSANSALRTGRCVDTPGGLGDKDVYDVDEVPCAGPHDGEVFHTFEMAGGSSYPGEGDVSDAAEDTCYARVDTYVMDSWAMTDEVDVYFLGPTEDTWRIGDRTVACILGHTDENETLTGSLRTDATTLDADQLAFLQAGAAIDDSLAEEPEEYPEDDLEANQAWAEDLSATLGEKITALRAHAWAAGVRQPVAAYLKDMEDARKEWARAAAAPDADTFYVHYDKGWEYVDGPTTVAARKALGLATTPPEYSYGDSDDSGSGGGSGGGLDV
jgi:hypothetical protein